MTEYVNKAECDVKFKELMTAITNISDRLYRDNGKRSIQSILNDHDRILKVLCWVLTVAGSAAIVALVGLIIERIV